ncbi:MAG: hypothetical protein NTY77_11675 [Elusimicrobia bacterium]|nr:hypothetical protein [Elusimicrobiota bacterium]
MSYRILVLVPGWLNEPAPQEGRWTSQLLRELGSRWGAAAALDPGGPGLSRGGLSFAPRAQRDFFEQVKEALFDVQVDVVLAVGEAASIDNLHKVAGWSPSTPRVSLLRLENFAASWREQLTGACELSDLVLLAAPWPRACGRAPEDAVPVGSAADVCAELGRRFLAERAAAAVPRACRDGVSILVRGRENGLRRHLGRLPFPCEVAPVRPGRGEVAAWNAALRRARYRCVLSLDGAALPGPGLCRMREYLRGEAPLAAVGAVRGGAPRSGSLALLSAAHGLAGRGHRECAPYLDAFCWMLDRGAPALAGLLDDRFLGLDSAVLDYCLRMRQLGLRLLSATDVLAFPMGRQRQSDADLAADLGLLHQKWCMETTKALELLCRKEPA